MPVEGPQYPVNLLLAGKPVLVVGGGRVAVAKVLGLLDGGADDVTVVAPVIDERIDATRAQVRRRRYEPPEAAGYRLVITATDDGAVNRRVHDDADAAGVWVNSADDPANCTFTLPARHRQGRLLLTASTGGHGPAVSSFMRRRFQEAYGPEYDALIGVVSEVREEILASGGSTEGLDWNAALGDEMLEADPHRSDRRSQGAPAHMPVVVVGVNHRTAPLELLERMTITDASRPKALSALLDREHVSEAVVLSTCNRTEVYAVAERFHGAYGDIRSVLAEVSHLPPDEFADHLYVHHDHEAIGTPVLGRRRPRFGPCWANTRSRARSRMHGSWRARTRRSGRP